MNYTLKLEDLRNCMRQTIQKIRLLKFMSLGHPIEFEQALLLAE